jgi:hypothetical protein
MVQGGNAGQCAATFASDHLPVPDGTPDAAKDVAKAVIGCIGSGADFATCASKPAITGAQNVVTPQLSQAQQDAIQKALDTIDRLKPDAEPAMDAGLSSGNLATVKNILGVAEGIRDKDWAKVVISAGPELAIIASNILLDIFITPALASALAPVVEAMIHNDVDAAIRAFNAIGAGNPVGLAQVLFEWYETSFIQAPCALLGNNDARDTICGALSDAIHEISEFGAGVAKDILGKGKDILEWLGLWGIADDTATFVWNTTKGFVEDVGHVFGIGDDDEPKWKPPADCATFSPASYMADHYAACLTKAVDAAASNTQDTGPMYDACVGALSRCVAPGPDNQHKVQQACTAMGTSLTDMARQTAAAIKTAADTYTGFGGPAAYVNKLFEAAKKDSFGAASPDFCSPNFWDAGQKQAYATGCQKFVEARFPQPGRMSPGACPLVTNTSASRNACLASLDASLAASAGQGESWGGPNSDYCKKEQEWIAANPCAVLSAGKPFLFPSGFKLDDIKIKCGHLITMPHPKGLPAPKLQPKPKGSRTGPDVVIHQPPKRSKPSGTNTLPTLPHRDSNIMDTLGAATSNGGIDQISGNNGYTPAITAPKPCLTCGGLKPGSGGHGPVVPAQPRRRPGGIAHGPPIVVKPKGGGGYNTSKPISSPPKSSSPGGPDDLIDYGGCSSCGPGKFVQPK